MLGLLGLGLIAISASRKVGNVLYDLVLIVVGVISYEYVGGFLWQLGPVPAVFAGRVGIVAKLAV